MNKFELTQAGTDAPPQMQMTRPELPTSTLANSEQRFRSFIDNSSDIFFELTASGSLDYVSLRWPLALGHPLQETLGQSFQSFVHPDDSASCLACFQRVLLGGEKNNDLAFRLRCQDGRYKDGSSLNSL
jgi:PAS domain S-box-containing protein